MTALNTPAVSRVTADEATLREFVAHSNRIEGEPDAPGHPRFDDHLATAIWLRDATGRPDPLKSPRVIHGRIMASEPEKFPGEYRQVAVGIRMADGSVAPKMPAVDVRPAMESLTHRAAEMVGSSEPSEQELWNLHHEFEHIHPFIDGNGRVGRLWLNALRLRGGYPWLTVRFEERHSYYDAIRRWEADIERER